MAKKKEGRPSWFKMFLHQKALIDSVPDETAGIALKAAFRYFDNEEVGELDPLAFAVFSAIKPYIDESFSEYQRSVNAGRAGGNKKWANKAIQGDSPPIPPLTSPMGVPTEAEAEAEADTDTEERAFTADSAPTVDSTECNGSVLDNSTAVAASAEGAPADEKQKDVDFSVKKQQAIQLLLNATEG